MNLRQHEKLSEDILLVLHDRTANYGHEEWDFISAFTVAGKEAEKQHADKVLSWLVGKGWIVADRSVCLQGSPLARVTDLGKQAAIHILDRRAPKSVQDRMRRVSRSDWIAIAAFVVSLIALFK